MSYVTHGFVSGMKLSAQALAELDEQIAQNETDIGAVTAGLSAVPGQRLQDIRKMRLTADSDAVFLYYDTELLSSIELPDVSDRVPCTGLTVTGTLTGMQIGNTAQITTVRQPVDCNQSVRFTSSDTGVATVSSAGLVTAVGRGSATVTVSCGTYSQTLNVKVAQKISLVNHISARCGWLNTNGYGSTHGAVFTTDGSNDYLGNYPFDFDKYVIHDGEKITVDVLQSGWVLRPGFVITAETGLTPVILDYRADADRYIIGNTTQVDSVTSGSASYTYTNNTGADCWIVFTVHYNGSTAEQALENVDSKVSVVIGPA